MIVLLLLCSVQSFQSSITESLFYARLQKAFERIRCLKIVQDKHINAWMVKV